MRSRKSSTPVELEARAELAAVASALSLDSLSDSDRRILQSVLSAAKSALTAPYAALTFLGSDHGFLVGDAELRETLTGAATVCLNLAAHSGDAVEVEDLSTHPSLANASFVRAGAALRWLITVPIVGYNGLVIGALSLFDSRPRLVLSEAERSTLMSLARVVEATMESHRTRVIARAQRALLVHRLRRSYAASLPLSNDYRRRLHELSNAITVLRLNSQVLEERKAFDPDTFQDIRNSIRLAENAARGLRLERPTPHRVEKMTWTRLCDWQLHRLEALPQSICEVAVHDESPNLVGKEPPSCLRDVASMLVDRAIETCNGRGRLTLSLRAFPHFIRFSVRVQNEGGLEESSAVIDPVYTHPARNALLAIGGGIVAEEGDVDSRWTAWFPADSGHNFVI